MGLCCFFPELPESSAKLIKKSSRDAQQELNNSGVKPQAESGEKAPGKGLLRRKNSDNEKESKAAAVNGVHAEARPNAGGSFEAAHKDAPFLAACEILERSQKAGSATNIRTSPLPSMAGAYDRPQGTPPSRPLLSGSQPSTPQRSQNVLGSAPLPLQRSSASLGNLRGIALASDGGSDASSVWTRVSDRPAGNPASRPLVSGSQPPTPQHSGQMPAAVRNGVRGAGYARSGKHVPAPMESTEGADSLARQKTDGGMGRDISTGNLLATSSLGNLRPEGKNSGSADIARRSCPIVPPALLPSVPAALFVRGSHDEPGSHLSAMSVGASTRGSASLSLSPSMDWSIADAPAPLPPEPKGEEVEEALNTFPVGIGVDLPLPEDPPSGSAQEPTMKFPVRAKARKQGQVRDDSAKEHHHKYRSNSAKGAALPDEPIQKSSHRSQPQPAKNKTPPRSPHTPHKSSAARRAARMWSQNGATQSTSRGVADALFSQADPLEGIPRFQRLQHLNSGSSGFVYHCLDKDADEEVAIKFVPRGRASAKAAEREILNLRLCAMHPYIIHLREVFLTREYLAIVFEYAPGGNLARYIETYQSSKPGRGLSEERTRWIFQQIVVSIDFCHKMGIANRDIKLENVLLVPSSSDPTQPPIVKLCDFGFSKDENADSTCKTACGTPECVAPEVLTQANYDGKASDIWSLGVMLYAMLTGTFPFSRPADDLLSNTAGMRKLFTRIANAQYPKPSHLSPPALDLLAEMLRPVPEERIDIAGILSHPWFGSRALQSVALGVNKGLEQMPDAMLTGFAKQSEEEILELTRAATMRSEEAHSQILNTLQAS